MSQELLLRDYKLSRIAIGILLLLMVLGTILYILFGHQSVQAIYDGKSFVFLNSLISGQDTWALKTYLDTSDGMFFTGMVLASVAMFLLWRLNICGQLGEKEKWMIGGGLVFLMILASFFRPSFGENELVYLIHPQKIANPEFLANDWTWQNNPYSHLIFDSVVSLFTLFLGDLSLALLGRLLAWGLLLGAFIGLAKTLRLTWWGFVLGFAFWLYAGQSLAASEWIFSGFEAKCFSYVFLFLALKGALEGKLVKSACFCGLSVFFHVVVGVWGTLALFISLLVTDRSFNLKRITLFCLTALLVASPGLIAIFFTVFQSGTMTQEHYAIDVFFRGPHHYDPSTFMTRKLWVELLFYVGLVIPMILKTFQKEHARLLLVFLATLMGLFALGIVARQLEWLVLLYYHPFRLGPLFLLLFFSFSAFRFLELYTKSSSLPMKILCLIVSGFLIFETLDRRMPEKLLKGSSATIVSWKTLIFDKAEDDFSNVTTWIHRNTPENSVFVAPPWEYGFWLLAKRAQVVSYKYIPVNTMNSEWMSRISDLNGGMPFRHRGSRALEDFKENYPNLTKVQLLNMKSKYQARYYLTVRERIDLSFPLIYFNNSYYLYEIQNI